MSGRAVLPGEAGHTFAVAAVTDGTVRGTVGVSDAGDALENGLVAERTVGGRRAVCIDLAPHAAPERAVTSLLDVGTCRGVVALVHTALGGRAALPLASTVTAAETGDAPIRLGIAFGESRVRAIAVRRAGDAFLRSDVALEWGGAGAIEATNDDGFRVRRRGISNVSVPFAAIRRFVETDFSAASAESREGEDGYGDGGPGTAEVSQAQGFPRRIDSASSRPEPFG